MPTYVAWSRAVTVDGRVPTNSRIERMTGRTSIWRDLHVIGALDEKWGA